MRSSIRTSITRCRRDLQSASERGKLIFSVDLRLIDLLEGKFFRSTSNLQRSVNWSRNWQKGAFLYIKKNKIFTIFLKIEIFQTKMDLIKNANKVLRKLRKQFPSHFQSKSPRMLQRRIFWRQRNRHLRIGLFRLVNTFYSVNKWYLYIRTLNFFVPIRHIVNDRFDVWWPFCIAVRNL